MKKQVIVFVLLTMGAQELFGVVRDHRKKVSQEARDITKPGKKQQEKKQEEHQVKRKKVAFKQKVAQKKQQERKQEEHQVKRKKAAFKKKVVQKKQQKAVKAKAQRPLTPIEKKAALVKSQELDQKAQDHKAKVKQAKAALKAVQERQIIPSKKAAKDPEAVKKANQKRVAARIALSPTAKHHSIADGLRSEAKELLGYAENKVKSLREAIVHHKKQAKKHTHAANEERAKAGKQVTGKQVIKKQEHPEVAAHKDALASLKADLKKTNDKQTKKAIGQKIDAHNKALKITRKKLAQNEKRKKAALAKIKKHKRLAAKGKTAKPKKVKPAKAKKSKAPSKKKVVAPAKPKKAKVPAKKGKVAIKPTKKQKLSKQQKRDAALKRQQAAINAPTTVERSHRKGMVNAK